jgi:hypothetical protein
VVYTQTIVLTVFFLWVQALAIAANGDNDSPNTDVFERCYALILFGVPNQGLRNEQLKAMVAGQPNEQLVRDLIVDSDSEASPYLKSLNQRFLDGFKSRDLHILCYFERKLSKTIEVKHLCDRIIQAG